MKVNTILAMAVLMGLSACAVKDTNMASKVARRKGTQTGAQNTSGTSTAEDKADGQPGLITLSGVVVKIENGSTTPDHRMAIQLTAGKDASGKVLEVSKDNQVAMTTSKADSDLEKLSSDKTYINLGCPEDKIDSSLINGLTAKSVVASENNSIEATAKVVLMCGASDIKNPFVTIKADTLVIKDLNLANKNSVGLTQIAANTLEMEGMNTISSTGVDSSSVVAQAASIDLNVAKELAGAGNLIIASTGGNKLSTEITNDEKEVNDILDEVLATNQTAQ